jgi:hypothetical protein
MPPEGAAGIKAEWSPLPAPGDQSSPLVVGSLAKPTRPSTAASFRLVGSDPSDDRDRERRAWQMQNSDEYHIEHRVLRAADGEYLWYQIRAKPLTRALSVQ